MGRDIKAESSKKDRLFGFLQKEKFDGCLLVQTRDSEYEMEF